MRTMETDRAAAAGMSFEEYAGSRWAALLRTARLLTGDPSSAEDLVQATLVKAYIRWPRVTSASSPEAYVRKILLNEFLGDRRRSQRRADKHHLLTVEQQPVPEPDPADRLDLWHQVLALPPRQRAVLVLRYYEDLTEAEIAHVLGVSPGTVKSQASDALRKLRSHYSPDETNPEVPR
jgi:RNA polymerase sigma-70 factor (sigma-E family)